MPDRPKTCPQCGARLPAEAEHCGLCGTALPASAGEDAAPSAVAASEEDPEAATGAFCNDCGWKNPPAANFCSRCGHPLQDVSREEAAAVPPGTKLADAPEDAEARKVAAAKDSSDGLGQRVALVTGAAVVVIAALFLISTWSDSGADTSAGASAPGPAAGASGAPAAMAQGGAASSDGNATRSALPPSVQAWANEEELPPSIAETADSLQQAVGGQRSGERLDTQRRQVRLLVGGGRPDRAALVQWALARATRATEDWHQAAQLLMEWADTPELAERTERPQLAGLAADAYRRVLDATPGDPDVRLGLASAYIMTNSPMRGISEIRSILDDHPDHVQTRMTYGMLQLQIGRRQTAIEQFERVQEIAGEGSPFYRQAEQLIQQIKSQSEGAPRDAPLPSGSPPAAGGAAPATPDPSGQE